MIQTHPKIAAMGGVKWNIGMTQEAERAAKIHQEAMNKGRRLPKMTKVSQRASDAETVHVFNVGPFTERVFLGSWGDFTIPACPPGQPWVYVCSIPGIYMETIPGEDKFDGEEIEGFYIAQEVLGEGPDLRNKRGESRRQTGLFIGEVRGPEGAEPKPEEVEAAQDSVMQYLHSLVLEANGAWGSGNEAEFKSVASSKHYLAAQLTGQTDVPWFKAKVFTKKEATVECPACGAQKSPRFPRCTGCGYTDKSHPRYEELFGEAKAEPAPKKISPEEEELRRLKAENEMLAKKK